MQAMAIVNAGVAHRATFETKMNEYSSRSHTVFTVTVIQAGMITFLLVIMCTNEN